jgi:hypothetical protein
MHEYSADNRKQERVIYFIAILSIFITPFANYLLSILIDFFNDYIAISYTITTFVVFTILYFLFNKILWRYFYWILKIPNLNGVWSCKGHSYKYTNSSTEYDWESEITIKQDWDKIGITQKTKESESFSTSIIGGIKIEDNDEVLLSYVYTNIPRNNTPELARHEGLVKLRFDKELRSASGDYFNDKSRQTYGTMQLSKKE